MDILPTIFHLIIFIIGSSRALIGFDCAGQHMNTTTISLLGTGACDLNITVPEKQTVYMQLLQLSEFHEAEVMQCKVEVHRTAYYCGMHSHVSILKNGEASYIEETHYERCKQMHREGTLHLGFGIDSLITNLKINRTGHYSILLAGELDSDGKCKGVRYQDGYGNWDDVVVQGVATVTLRTSYSPVNLNTGKIHLKSGTTCDLGDGIASTQNTDTRSGRSYQHLRATSTNMMFCMRDQESE